MAPAYQYMPLLTGGEHDGSIRVLELSPGTFDNRVIYVKLRSTNIEAMKNKFEAVSYTWGDPTPCKTIIFEESNTQLQVSRNCYSVLRHLRNTAKTRILWIDAICINQADIPERNSQVRIMGSIYASANQTTIFLGYSTPGSRFLFRHLARTDRLLSSDEEQEPQFLPKITKRITRELEHLLKRAWFSRVWVIQELMRSLRVKFMCGRHTATIEALNSSLRGHKRNLRVFSKFPAPLELDHENFKEMLRSCSTPARKMYMLAAGAGLCKSTDPRDRILALTPLAAELSPELGGLINYNLATEEIFHQFALSFLFDGGLALLWMIRHPHSRDMPSWVPDWTENRGKSHRTIQLPDFFKAYESDDSYDSDYTDDSNESDESNYTYSLVVSGVRYGRIQELGPVIQINQENIRTRIKAVRALVADLESMTGSSNPPSWPHSIVEAFRGLTREDVQDLLRSGSSTILREANEELSFNIAIACHESRVFITSEKELGLSPEGIQPGDLVCLVKGAIEPCVLRERDHDRWTVRGYRRSGFDWPWRYINELISGPQEQFSIC
ncbi:HET-domain-containing protein [Xylaria longipes]|nr:HET-domain-containing protein [Xylaria longipes]